MPLTLSELTGPLPVLAGMTCTDADLLLNARLGVPPGDAVLVEGYVRDETGDPLPDVLIELWQCDGAGRYPEPIDPSKGRARGSPFLGFGRCLTDAQGYYRFRTIRPGRPRDGRAAHLHFSVFGPSWLSRLFTHLYFPEDPWLSSDPTLRDLPSESRERLVARRCDMLGEPLPIYRFDITVPVPKVNGREPTHRSSSPDRVSASTTPPRTLGRFFRSALLRGGFEVVWNRLASSDAHGERVRIRGRVSDPDGKPVPNALVEVWQANGYGRYHHPADRRGLPWDPAFVGFGRCVTDENGVFLFETVRPGAVVAEGLQQSPHVNVCLVLPDDERVYRTRVYFEDSLEDAHTDPILGCLRRERRLALVARRTGGEGATACYEWEVPLREGGAGAAIFLEFAK